jgi:ABC-type nitrate/sulfonate/bicarbonate transport system permease component
MTVEAAVLRRLPSQRRQRVGAFAVASLTALAIWQVATWISGGWVPSLWRILQAFADDASTSNMYVEMWITFRRILITFAAATAIGIGLGAAMGLNNRVSAFFRPIVVMALAIPDPVYIIVAILVLGTEESSGLIAMTLALIPFVVTIVIAGVRARDPGLDEMSAVYRLPRRRYLVDVVGWQVTPALMAATRTCFAFSWKLVVLVEALTQPRGIGAQIYYSFRLLRPAHMISQALMFIIVLRVVEAAIFTPLERKLLGWLQ